MLQRLRIVKHVFTVKWSNVHLCGNYPQNFPLPLHQLHKDICGPINPPSRQYRYFLVIVNALGSHSEVLFFTIQNMTFPKFLAILIRYKNHFPDYPIKYLQIDNTVESRSHTFEDYCVATGITLTYFVSYEQSLNGLAEVFIKKIQLITRPLLLHANMPSTMWGHAILHVASLLR